MNISIDKILALVLIISLSACSESIRVMHVNKTTEKQEAIIYNLPKTAMLIEVEVQKTINFKGPFAEYTDLYFQTNRTVLRNETFYKLKNVHISSFPMQDSGQFYAIIMPPKKQTKAFISLSEEQYPVGIRSSVEAPDKPFNELINIENTEIHGPDYADLSIHSVRETVYDTTYTTVFKDSVFVKVPKIYTRKQFKSPKKQAREMAEQIFRLRDDRLALIKGVVNSDNFPDGNAIKLMINELNKYEHQYMTMFTGQTNISTKKYKFVYIPSEKSAEKNYTLFKFSEKFGILPANLEQGKAFNIHLQKNKNLNEPEKYLNLIQKYKTQENIKNTCFAYRIPGKAKVLIYLDKELLLDEEITIAQYGLINYLPAEILNNPNTEILFNTELGALKRISSVKK